MEPQKRKDILIDVLAKYNISIRRNYGSVVWLQGFFSVFKYNLKNLKFDMWMDLLRSARNTDYLLNLPYMVESAPYCNNVVLNLEQGQRSLKHRVPSGLCSSFLCPQLRQMLCNCIIITSSKNLITIQSPIIQNGRKHTSTSDRE